MYIWAWYLLGLQSHGCCEPKSLLSFGVGPLRLAVSEEQGEAKGTVEKGRAKSKVLERQTRLEAAVAARGTREPRWRETIQVREAAVEENPALPNTLLA